MLPQNPPAGRRRRDTRMMQRMMETGSEETDFRLEPASSRCEEEASVQCEEASVQPRELSTQGGGHWHAMIRSLRGPPVAAAVQSCLPALQSVQSSAALFRPRLVASNRVNGSSPGGPAPRRSPDGLPEVARVHSSTIPRGGGFPRGREQALLTDTTEDDGCDFAPMAAMLGERREGIGGKIGVRSISSWGFRRTAGDVMIAGASSLEPARLKHNWKGCLKGGTHTQVEGLKC